jgi:hypothetical protein
MKTLTLLVAILMGLTAFAQIDTDQLSLDISKADAANMQKLKAFIWKKESVVTVDGEEKMSMLNEISISEDNKVNITNLDAESSVQAKRGLRGRIQQSTAENNAEYMEGAIEHALSYTYMSKGQLLDFFSKADIIEKDGIIKATASDIFVKGDNLTIKVESDTKLFLYKKFTSTMGEDPISGEIKYDKFTSGISHVSEATLNLPAKKAVIHSKNRDYVQKVL